MTAEQIIRALVEDRMAGLASEEILCEIRCLHCDSVQGDMENVDHFEHSPDCPIRKGREWLAERGAE